MGINQKNWFHIGCYIVSSVGKVLVNHQLQIPEYFLVTGRAKIVEAGRVVALEHAIDSCRSVDGADLVGIVLDVDASHF